MQQRDTFCIFDRFSKLVLSWSWVDVFCSTKNRLKLKKLDKNCNQSIISKEHHLIVIFQRTQMRFVVASQVPLRIWLVSLKQGSVQNCCQASGCRSGMETLTGSGAWWSLCLTFSCGSGYNLLLLAGGGFYGCSLLESKSLLRSVCQLRRLNWIWNCLHG